MSRDWMLITHVGAWSAAVERAGYRCECIGQCGRRTHSSAGRGSRARVRDHRCSQTMYGRRGMVAGSRLIVTSTDLTVPLAAAATLPVSGLQVWCEGCLAHAQAAVEAAGARQRAEALADAQGELLEGWSA